MTQLAAASYVIGAILMVAAGFAIAGGLLWLAAWATGKYAWRTWSNLSSIYKLYTMQYWFKRMDKDGTHVLQKAYEEKRAAQLDGGQEGSDK